MILNIRKTTESIYIDCFNGYFFTNNDECFNCLFAEFTQKVKIYIKESHARCACLDFESILTHPTFNILERCLLMQ